MVGNRRGSLGLVLEDEVLRFQGWLRAREIGPTIAELKRHAETIVQGELERAAGKLAALPEPDRQVVEALLRRVTRRLLHFPIVHLRDAAQSGNGYHEVNAVRSIFRLGTRAVGEESPGRRDLTPSEPGAELVDPRSLGPEP